jgi:hypothetical protein
MERQDTKQRKKTQANTPKCSFESPSTHNMVEISRFLEMKIESVTFKVYINNRAQGHPVQS